jgi:hypothetical protein
MTETTGQSQITQNGRGNDMLVIAAAAAVILGLLWFFNSDSKRQLERSATGFNGLISWLRSNDVEARTFRGGGTLIEGEIGLRILPLFDVDLTAERETPTTRSEVIAQTSERDLGLTVFELKVEAQPTLVVLPKWRHGMRMLKVAHKDLLIPDGDLNRVLRQIGIADARVRRDPGGFARTGHDIFNTRRDVGLVHTQTVKAKLCEPILGTKDAMLLGRCELGEDVGFWLLTDPDLINNHGLSLAENAQTALNVIEIVNTTKPVIVDLTTHFATVDGDFTQDQHERTWEDFARMFEWPFSVIWIGFLFIGGLVLWRAITRYGPLARIYEEEPRASKTTSIAAKARLLRMSNHDAALLRTHFRSRLNALAADLLGPHRPADQDALEVVSRLVARKSPELARELATAVDLSSPETGAQGSLIAHLDRFETCYDRINHEFGRASVARG